MGLDGWGYYQLGEYSDTQFVPGEARSGSLLATIESNVAWCVPANVEVAPWGFDRIVPVTPGNSGSYVVPLVDYRIEMDYVVPPTVIVYRGGMELTGGSSGTGFTATGNLGIGTVAADTDSATPEGLPWQVEAKLANFVSNFELGDGVSDDGPLPPTPTLTALAAAGAIRPIF